MSADAEFVIGRLPRDLLAVLEVTPANNDFQVRGELSWGLTEDELGHANRILQGVTDEFCGRLTSLR
ncbi:hypothetical protein [Nonomuraea sp. NPDC005650]|uniref:hypothetical protein n=1 Tax=Nonomuraea sp. NPDC005650 TaxID=3157045 RepID=UPI0033A6C91B